MDNQPRRWLERLLEAAVILAVSAYLIRLAACYFAEALPFIIIVVTIVVVGIVAYRIWKRKHDSNW